jgi:hypothetical protein
MSGRDVELSRLAKSGEGELEVERIYDEACRLTDHWTLANDTQPIEWTSTR